MAFERLKSTLSSTLLLIRALLLTLLIVPILALWRLLIFLLSCICTPLHATWLPSLILHITANTYFLRTWATFVSLPALLPVVKYRARIICSSLLLTQTVLAFSILVESSMLFIPWLLRGGHTRGELKVNTVLFLGTCVPVAWVAGVGVSVLYYARKVWKYGRFQKKMRRRPGGRGYWMDPSDGEEKRSGAKKEGAVAVAGEGKNIGDEERGSGVEAKGVRWTGNTLVDGRFATVSRSESVQRLESVGKGQGKSLAKHGLSSVWNIKDRFQRGYDGREIRRTAWQAEELEMNDLAKP